MSRRVLLDISTLARASGHADGIVRTLRELAMFAVAHRPEISFVLYDMQLDTPRTVKPEWAPSVIDGSAKIDTSYFADPASPKKRFRERLPAPLKRVFLWIQRPRRQIFLNLERLRIAGGSLGRVAERLQKPLLGTKYAAELAMPGGGRRTLLPYQMALDEAPSLTRNDIVILAGSDWLAMSRQLTQGGERPKLVVLCYDIIPLLFPDFFLPANRDSFRACFNEVFPHADLIVFTANQIMIDAKKYCLRHGMTLGRSEIVYLGSNFAKAARASQAALPSGLQMERYALFVSTIEPRKGHGLLLKVWKRLLAEGVPQRHNFKLVFVGRKGWLVDDLMKELRQQSSIDDSLVMLSNIDDGTLQALYAGSAFCLFPSRYEGFGLPVIEAFRYGKAVIASNAGALLETVGGFSPCLDPLDEDAWYDNMKRWIEDPAARKIFEDAIRADFRPRDWASVAREFFELIDRDLGDSVEPMLESSQKIAD